MRPRILPGSVENGFELGSFASVADLDEKDVHRPEQGVLEAVDTLGKAQ